MANIDKIPDAELNILVSPWAGLESLEFLKAKYGAPFLHSPVLPIGAFETSKFLRALGEAAGVERAALDRAIDEGEREYYYYIERYADIFLEQRIMGKRFVCIADAHYALGCTTFLVNDLGMFPSVQFITDDTPERYQNAVREEFKKLNYGIEAEAVFSTDGDEIHRRIRETDFGGNPLIIGSNWERHVAPDVSGIFVNVSYPLVSRMVINSHLAGYSGGLKLLEDIYTEARERLAL
jgi:nitrogenase molybdenum-iron protein beta chain